MQGFIDIYGRVLGRKVPENSMEILVKGATACPGKTVGKPVVVITAKDAHLVQKGDILVSPMTTPDCVPAMKRAAAIVTERGGRTCHAAIVARELGIPCIVGAIGAVDILAKHDLITVDATRGEVFAGAVDLEVPSETEVSTEQRTTKTKVYVNLADPDSAARVAELSVDGVGLLRAEFIAAHIGEHPRFMLDAGRGSEYTQKLADGIRTFAKAFYPRPVVYRTTDFKTNEYRNLIGGEHVEEQEENPMIGFRGAFRHLADPEIFRLETEAIRLVQQELDNVRVMIPFIRTPEELQHIKIALAENGVASDSIWIMVEVPSTVILLDAFIDLGIGGVSIGTNDLTQLILGIDRDNAKYAHVFDERNPAVMWCLERIITTCKRRNISISMCGQTPSFYPDLTAKLVEWGITSVSVSPDMIDQPRRIVADAESKLR